MSRSKSAVVAGAIVLIGMLGLIFILHGQSNAGNWEFPQDWFWHDTDEQRARHAELLGHPLPPLEVTEWMNGEVKPEDLKGKVVVIDIWATWCGPCIAAVPHNNELMQRYANSPVVILGVCSSEE